MIDEHASQKDNFIPFYDFEHVYRYNYSKLSFKLQKIYMSFENALKKGYNSITLRSIESIEYDSYFHVLSSVINDDWHLFYVSSKLVVIKKPLKVHIKFFYNEYYEKRNEYFNKLKNLSSTLFESLPLACTSYYDVEQVIYDYVTCSVKYEMSKQTFAHTLIGPLLYGRGVCEGISQAFEMLCCCFGLNVSRISGFLDGVPHSWNVVSINGMTYHADVTNDLESQTHYFFNRNDNMIGKTHSGFQIISPYQEQYTYYLKNWTFFHSLSDLKMYLDGCSSFLDDYFEFQLYEHADPRDVFAVIMEKFHRQFTIVCAHGCHKVLFSEYKKRFNIIHDNLGGCQELL